MMARVGVTAAVVELVEEGLGEGVRVGVTSRHDVVSLIQERYNVGTYWAFCPWFLTRTRR